MKYLSQTLSLSLATFALTVGCHAVATVSGVPGSKVTEGDRSWEYRSSYQNSDNGPSAFSHRAHYQHALNDRQRVRFIVTQAQREGSPIELSGGRFEYLWQYHKPGNDSAGSAFRFDLQIAEGDNEPHFGRVVWIKEFSNGPWRSRFNLLVGKDFGENARSGASLASRGQISRGVGDYTIGTQYLGSYNTFNDMRSFDEQRHQAGIFVSRKFGDWRVFGSYLAGVSDRSPDHAVRFFFGKSL